MKKFNFGVILFVIIAISMPLWTILDTYKRNEAVKNAKAVLNEYLDLWSDILNVPDYVLTCDDEELEKYFDKVGTMVSKLYRQKEGLPEDYLFRNDLNYLRVDYIQKLKELNITKAPKVNVFIRLEGDIEESLSSDRRVFKAGSNLVMGFDDKVQYLYCNADVILENVHDEWKILGSYFWDFYWAAIQRILSSYEVQV